MSKNDVVLTDNIVGAKIDVKEADIIVASDNIKEPLIRCSGHFDIVEKERRAVITEKTVGNDGSKTRIMLNGGAFVQSSSDISITYKNGIATVGGFALSKEPITKNFIEVIVPKKTDGLDLCLQTLNGNVTVKDLMLSRLMIKTLSGNVNLTDIDALFTTIKTESGNIDMKILESVLNYQLFLKSIGTKVQNETNSVYPVILDKKHELELESQSGEVKVLFKGKKFTRH